MRNFVRRGDVQASHVDLNDLVREVSELCRPELRDANVSLTLDLAPCPVLALADAVQIQQVMVNLIHNAIQAMGSTPGIGACSAHRHADGTARSRRDSRRLRPRYST